MAGLGFQGQPQILPFPESGPVWHGTFVSSHIDLLCDSCLLRRWHSHQCGANKDLKRTFILSCFPLGIPPTVAMWRSSCMPNGMRSVYVLFASIARAKCQMCESGLVDLVTTDLSQLSTEDAQAQQWPAGQLWTIRPTQLAHTVAKNKYLLGVE